MKSSPFISAFILLSIVILSACNSPQENTQQQALPNVSVAQVIHQKLTEWDEFTGRIQAPQSVELRPRVSGYLDFVALEEGTIVKPGDPLFFIDNRPFKAEVKRLKAELLDAKSKLELAKREYVRAQDLVKKKAISEELLDNRYATQQQANAHVASVNAALDIAKLNLSYTRVSAPIAGRVSNAKITKGNYVTAGQSILTTIVSTSEVYAYFDADEQTYLKYAQLASQGTRPSSRDTKNPVFMGLASDKDYPYQGHIDFVDNIVNESTGTIRGRAVFNNEDGLLIPGLFARIKLLGTASYDGILVDDKAIGTDLSNKFVLVVDEENTLHYRAITIGEKIAGLRIIKSGLEAGDKIVVKGLQRVRPGVKVNAELIEMTTTANVAELQKIQQQIDSIDAQGQLALNRVGE